jgi:S1-C subfamily serine protease
MVKIPKLPKPLLATLAKLFAAAVILYTGLWMLFGRWLPAVELGFDEQYIRSGHYELVTGVGKDSPAEKAGLQPGDRILAIDGRPLDTAQRLLEAISQAVREFSAGEQADDVTLVVARGREPEVIQ